MTTIHELRRIAKSVGAEIEVDEDCQCYRATAPDGFRFVAELHELVSRFGGIVRGLTRADAREDLAGRLSEYGAVEPCDTPNCDWCERCDSLVEE